MRSTARLSLLIPIMLASGCASIGGADRETACAGWRPIRLDPESVEALTDRDALAVLEHNEFGRRAGCWSPA